MQWEYNTPDWLALEPHLKVMLETGDALASFLLLHRDRITRLLGFEPREQKLLMPRGGCYSLRETYVHIRVRKLHGRLIG